MVEDFQLDRGCCISGHRLRIIGDAALFVIGTKRGVSRAVGLKEEAKWDLPSPFISFLTVEMSNIDMYDHVNNSVYMTWFDKTAWEHSASVGLTMNQCLELDRGMAVLRSVISYIRPALVDERLSVATWILPAVGKLRIRRRFQVRRGGEGITLARADIEYACIELSSGRPVRWPGEFRERYLVLEDVAAAVHTLAPI